MLEKLKIFSDLSSRQKRRRISTLRGRINVRTKKTEAFPISKPSTSGYASKFFVTNEVPNNTENYNYSRNENNREEEA